MKANYWKAVVLIGAALALFFLGKSCGRSSVLKNSDKDTLVRKDSLIVRYKPMPYKVIQHDTVYVPIRKKRFNGVKPYLIPPPIDTAEILKDFFETAVYFDRRKIGRTEVTIEDTVTQNMIIGRGVTVVTSDSIITRTVTFYPQKRSIVYVTGSVMADRKLSNYGAGVGLAMKLPNDIIYQAEYKLTNNGPVVEARLMLPIRFNINPFKR